MAKVKCPRITCRSTNVEPVATKKKLSFGKAVVGGLLFGNIGAATGLAAGKNGKTTFFCKDCGHTFEMKV